VNQLEQYLTAMSSELDETDAWHVCAHTPHGGDAQESEIELYDHLVESSRDERPLQIYLQQRPWILPGDPNGGGSCRWVLAQYRLGPYVPDFLIARLDSTGVRWTLVELQSPVKPLFTQTGNLAEHLNEGLRQISDWRRWIAQNLDHASKPTHEGGLGLAGIKAESDGLILIGRREDRSGRARERLLDLSWNNHVSVHSYDWVSREARRREEIRVEHGLENQCKCF
jgi:Domain of unknown function (DUF4263)